jgi:hypothetical protein
MAMINVARESARAQDRKKSWVIAHGFGNLERAMAG